MNIFRERLLHLHHCSGIGWKSIYRILQFDPTLSSIYNLSSKTFEKILSIPEKSASLLLKDLHSHNFQSMLKQYREKNIHCITIIDDDYPENLTHIYDPPWVLYAAGNLPLLTNRKMLSVVGSRTPTQYGYRTMEKLLVPLIKEQWVIVSGLARGIDTQAHQLSIDYKSHTIAIIAGGFYNIYPKENLQLAKMIMKNHLLLSEYPPHIFPQKWQFPVRNRIISGLSLGTLIIEAQERSGSLITADQALQQGREVFAVPGSIFDPNSTGTNKLIQAGAKLVLSSEDILSELPLYSC